MVADGWAGQNKNTTVLLVASKWLVSPPTHIKTIELIFPVTGHSFMPPDRVFGKSEKRLRKIETIVTPDEYAEEIENIGSKILRRGEDWHVFGWKAEAKRVLKTTSSMHFKISQIKKLLIKRIPKSESVLVQAYESFSEPGIFKSILKRGSRFSTVSPEIIEKGRVVKSAKLRDMKQLLEKHSGKEWKSIENLKWYIPSLDSRIADEESADDAASDDDD